MTELLPELPEGTAQSWLDEAAERGRVHLCDTDEAELRAIGFSSAGRAPTYDEYAKADAPQDDPEIVAAAARLVERGLATPEPTTRGSVTPTGPLLMFLRTALLRCPLGLVSHVPVADPPAGRRAARLQLLARQVQAPLAMVDSLVVPSAPPATPLPVSIDLVRHDLLAADLAGAARPGGEGQVLTRVLLPARHCPAEVLAEGDAGVLSTPGHGLRHQQTRSRQVSARELETFLAQALDEAAGG